jgi:hypothetical protein
VYEFFNQPNPINPKILLKMKSVDDQLKEIRTANGKSLYDMQQKRARITALILAAATVISLIFLVIAFVQKSRGDEIRSELEAVKTELEACRSSK